CPPLRLVFDTAALHYATFCWRRCSSRMKNICHVLFTTAVLVLVSGCATSPTTAPPATSTSEARSSYDDQKIRNIKKGETSENDLVEWFGPPAAREMKPDGRSFLSWQFEPGAQGQRVGL